MPNRSKNTRIGIIGCGAIAEIYHLPAVRAIAGLAEYAVCADSNLERAEATCSQFGLAKAFGDYREMLGSVDGVIVATPPQTHFEISKFFLEQGIHVLCEKPLSECYAEAEELVEIAKASGAKLAVNQTRRFFPTYRKIRELIAAGKLGTLQRITYHDGIEFSWPAASPHHFSKGAKGAWSDSGVHLLDTLLYWLSAESEFDGAALLESKNDSSGGPEALATVTIHSRECVAEAKVSRLGRLMNGFEIHGTLGSIKAEAEEWSEVIVTKKSGGRERYRVGSRKQQYTDFAFPLLKNFVEVIEAGAEPTVSGEETLETIRLLEEAYEQARSYEMPWNEQLPSVASAAVVKDTRKRVLVTGASGFLGGRLVELFENCDFATPIAAIRSWTRASRPARAGAEIALVDIEDRHQVDQVMRSVDAVVHCAKDDTKDSIVGGTNNLLESALQHSVSKFVFLSTAEVYGAGVSGNVDEEWATEKSGREYGDNKIEAEELCRSFHSRGLKPVILRPSLIYGPYSNSWSTDIAKRLESGKWGRFDELGEGFANLIYVDDLAQAIMLAITSDVGDGESFNVNGPDQPPTWNEYFELFNDQLGRPPLEVISAGKTRWRTRLMDTVGYAADIVLERFEDKLMEIYLRGGWPSKVMKKIKGELKSTPSGGELEDLFSRKAKYVDQKIRNMLGYQPAVDLLDGIRRTNAWLALHEVIERDPVDQYAGPYTVTQRSASSSMTDSHNEELVG